MAILEILIAVLLLAVRVLESVNELRKTPELNTAQKCWQVLTNFFTVERYIPAEKI